MPKLKKNKTTAVTATSVAVVPENALVNKMKGDANKTLTENGAITYRSSLDRVLDFYYHAPARQGQDNRPLFFAAFEQDRVMAMKALFYLHDVRGGKGQRETFRDILLELYNRHLPVFEKIISYVPEYGRWDTVMDYPESPAARALVKEQLSKDLNSDRPSLLGKWLPSGNTSSKETRRLASAWQKVLGLTPRQYRKTLTELRKKIGVVEQLMSAKRFELID